MNPSPKSLLNRVVSATVVLVLVALGLSFAWHLVRPLLPVLVIGSVAFVVLKVLKGRRNEW